MTLTCRKCGITFYGLSRASDNSSNICDRCLNKAKIGKRARRRCIRKIKNLVGIGSGNLVCPICNHSIKSGIRLFASHFQDKHNRLPTGGELKQAQTCSRKVKKTRLKVKKSGVIKQVKAYSRKVKNTGFNVKKTDAMFHTVSGSFELGKRR